MDNPAIDMRHLDAIADADPYPYWYDDADEPDSNPTLVRTESCDLCIVGGGYTGLWTAIIAKERDPSRDVILIDAHEVGSAASGRNGGFMDSSLTHGVANAQQRFPDEVNVLEELGLHNLNEIESAIRRYNIDCDYERTGAIDVATSSHPASYLAELRDDYQQLRSLGQSVEWLDQETLRSQVHSPTYSGGLWRKDRAALVDPARLAWGLKTAAESLGVRIYEDSKATSVEKDGVGVLVDTPLGRVRAGKVALGTNAFKPLLKRLGHYVAPVYDYCLVTEPLTPAQLASIGWQNRQGISDIPNQFHYYRLTADNRILWGGYDAMYYFRGKMNTELESRPESWALLSQHFFTPGAGQSIPAHALVFFGVAQWVVVLLMRLDTPVLVQRPHDSELKSCLISLMVVAAKQPPQSLFKINRSLFLPSHSVSLASKPRDGHLIEKTKRAREMCG